MTPKQIKLHKTDGSLELVYPNGSFTLSGEYLRVYSPSAEVKGHGPGQEQLQHGKKNVRVTSLEKSGNYALRLTFSDGHNSGIYSWTYLQTLCDNQDNYWQTYLDKLHQAGLTRDPETQVVRLK